MQNSREHKPVFRMVAIGIAVLVAAAIITGCSTSLTTQRKDDVSAAPLSYSPDKVPANGLVQNSTGGAVSIDVKWLGVDNDKLVFDVSMDTHSVDLDQYNLGSLSVLLDEQGNQYIPTSWQSAPGGHHRKGTLTFATPDSLSQGKTKYVELIVRDVAGVGERVFKWEVS